MDEKEIIRIAVQKIQANLNAALEECEKVEILKQLFYEKFDNLLQEFIEEMLKLHSENPELI